MHLRDLWLTVSQLNFETSFIARHGSLFKVIGVPPRVVFYTLTYGSLESAIIVRVGGRKGCVFGSMVSNTPYALPSWH